jgi:putative flippase GtrA
MRKLDAILSALIGLVVAVVLMLVARNSDFSLPLGGWLLAAFPVLAVVGIYVSWKLQRIRAVFFQLGKFFLVGSLNTFVDLGVLNLFIYSTGIAEGARFSIYKGIAFLVALINSYYWNRYWTFTGHRGGFVSFTLVSVLGLLINVGVASLVVNVVGPLWGANPALWANIGAVTATVISLLWNFVGYKFFVFKPSS